MSPQDIPSSIGQAYIQIETENFSGSIFIVDFDKRTRNDFYLFMQSGRPRVRGKSNDRGLLNLEQPARQGSGQPGKPLNTPGPQDRENAGLTANKLVTLKKAALPHDIGKIFIPEEIIHNKPGPLTKSEKSVDRRHPLLGNWLLAGFSSFNQEVVIIVAHHEKWDGS